MAFSDFASHWWTGWRHWKCPTSSRGNPIQALPYQTTTSHQLFIYLTSFQHELSIISSWVPIGVHTRLSFVICQRGCYYWHIMPQALVLDETYQQNNKYDYSGRWQEKSMPSVFVGNIFFYQIVVICRIFFQIYYNWMIRVSSPFVPKLLGWSIHFVC